MSKPKAPAPPDYAAAAVEQGKANTNSAIATNFLNQANQVGPNGSLNYTYDTAGGYTLPDGTVIPRTTATTTLSPDQQKLYDQNNLMSRNLNDLAIRGIGYVDQASQTPIDQSQLPGMVGSLQQRQFRDGTGGEDFTAHRDRITEAMMQRMQPNIDRQREQMRTQLANQGITQGSEAYGTEQHQFQQGVNDQRIAALLAGDQEQQMYWDQEQRGLNNYNQAQEGNFAQGLASGQFTNQARSQAIQEADYFKNQPLNMLNSLRTGGQTQMPVFGNVSAGSSIAPAPTYAAVNDSYTAALEKYRTDSSAWANMLSGITGVGGAAVGKWG